VWYALGRQGGKEKKKRAFRNLVSKEERTARAKAGRKVNETLRARTGRNKKKTKKVHVPWTAQRPIEKKDRETRSQPGGGGRRSDLGGDSAIA